MNLTERIKNLEHIDIAEVFDISDTKEIVNANYEAVTIAFQALDNLAKEYSNANERISIELEEARVKDKKRVAEFNITFNVLIAISVFSLFISFWSIIPLCVFLYIRFKDKSVDFSWKNEFVVLDKKNPIEEQEYIISERKWLYEDIAKQLSEILKIHSNSQYTQAEKTALVLTLKTNFEASQFQSKMLDSAKRQELSSSLQLESQRKQEKYAEEQLKSQKKQEDIIKTQAEKNK